MTADPTVPPSTDARSHGDDPVAPTIEALLEEVRTTYRRVDAREAALAVHQGALLVDIRPARQRASEGEVPGALVVERNVLEWRLTPTSEDRLDELDEADGAVIILCSEGYASTLAAASLRALGLAGATDLVGGFHAWKEAGLPTVGPDDAGGSADAPPGG